MPIDSRPQGAIVIHEGKVIGRTPMTAALDREASGSLLLTLDGYHDKSATVPSRLHLAVLRNIVFGWAFGLAVDAATGNVDQRRTSPLFVSLLHAESDSITQVPVGRQQE